MVALLRLSILQVSNRFLSSYDTLQVQQPLFCFIQYLPCRHLKLGIFLPHQSGTYSPVLGQSLDIFPGFCEGGIHQQILGRLVVPTAFEGLFCSKKTRISDWGRVPDESDQRTFTIVAEKTVVLGYAKACRPWIQQSSDCKCAVVERHALSPLTRTVPIPSVRRPLGL